MLLSFAVTNFRSIRERTVLSMFKGGLKGLPQNYINYENKKQALRSAVIYGANASGKSNFLGAIKALEYLILGSASNKPDEKLGAYEPYRLDPAYSSQPVTFEITFISDQKQYDYQLSFLNKQVVAEELFFYPSNTKSLLFSRSIEKEMKFGDYYKGGKKTLEKLLLPNQLFLSKAAENNVDSLMSPYSFFAKNLEAFSAIESYVESTYARRLYARRLIEDGDSLFTKQFNSLICALDTGVQKVTAKEVEWKDGMFPGSMPDEVKKQIREDFRYEIKTHHAIYDGDRQIGQEAFDINDESDGTQSLLFIGGLIIDALVNGRVLIVDEFEKSLHPYITRFLIQLFHKPEVNKKGAQLIFATHDITQLSNESFRRDQVWFSEKDIKGGTKLKRCSDLSGLRLNTPVDKWYVAGAFGAVPNLKDVDFLIEMQKDEEVESV